WSCFLLPFLRLFPFYFCLSFVRRWIAAFELLSVLYHSFCNLCAIDSPVWAHLLLCWC
ncbi:unnamed protein product, partial [Staurois parvus]